MSRTSKTVKIVIAGVVLLVALAGVGLWFFFKDDAPPEVSSAAARETAEAAAVEQAADEPAATDDTEAPGGIEGTWTVNSDIGTFDFSESASATFVGFRVEEELTSVGSTTAVGRTPAVTGEITIEDTTLTEASFEADMTQITTDRQQRNSRVQGALGTGEFPTAAFVLTEPVDLGAAAESGPVTVTVSGDLTIHGVTQSVEIPLTAELVGEIITVTGQLDIVFDDYDVQVPSAPVVVSASDEGIVEILLFLTRP